MQSAGAAADGDDQAAQEEPATAGAVPGRRRVLKTVLLAFAIALIGIVAVFGFQRIAGTELSPGTGEIQRTIGDSDAVAPRDDSGAPQDAPEDTEQQEDSGEGGLPEPQEGESPQEQGDSPQDEGDGNGDVDAPEVPAEHDPAPGTGDGGGGSSGGDSGEGDSTRSSGSGSFEGRTSP